MRKAYQTKGMKVPRVWGAWVAQSVKCQTLGFGSHHDPGVVGLSSVSGSTLSLETAWNVSPFFSVSLFLSLK